MLGTLPSNSLLHLGSITAVRFSSRSCGVASVASKEPSTSVVVGRHPNSGTERIVRGVGAGVTRVGRDDFTPNVSCGVSCSMSHFLSTSVRSILGALLRTFVLMFVIICVFLRSFHSALVPTVTMPISLINAFFFVRVLNFSVGVLALFTLILTVNVMMSGTVIIMRTIRMGVRRRGLSPCGTSMTTVGRVNKTVVTVALIVSTIFIPINFVRKAMNVFCQRFSLALTMTVIVSKVGTLALSPTLYTLLLGPTSKGGGGGTK